MFLHIGNRIRVPSNVNTKPAPLEIQTEYFRALRASNLELFAWKYLRMLSELIAGSCRPAHIPSKCKHKNMGTPK